MNIEFFDRENFPVEEAERAVGHVFKDKELLIRAFTRSSYAHERKGVKDNETLEFLGDSVLGLIVSTSIFGDCDSVKEMTEKKKKVVSTKPLSFVSTNEGFFRYLIMGKGDRKQFSLANVNVLEDLFEAIVGAIYLDGGLNAAKRFVYKKLLSNETAQNLFSDHVSELKEYCEVNKIGDIRYDCKRVSLDQRSAFIADVYVKGEFVSSAYALGSEADAKQAAAEIALAKLIK